MRGRILLALAAAAVFAGNAAAQASAQADKRAATLFNRLDTNKDGFVTRDEARDATELQGRFAELDVNNDGKLSREEMQALNAKPDTERSGSGSSTRSDSAKTGKSR